MPNYVTTTATVTGPAASLAAFRERQLADGEFSLAAVTEVPQEILATEHAESNWAELWEFALSGVDPRSEDDRRVGVMIYGTDDYAAAAPELSGMPSPRSPAAVKAWLESEASKYWPNVAEVRKHGEARVAARAATGCSTWYEWNRKNWGTKWDAMRTEVLLDADEELSFRFETAWEFPRPVFDRLGVMYPDLSFAAAAFDEGHCFALEGRWFAGIQNVSEYPGEQLGCDEELMRRLYLAAYGKTYVEDEDDGDDDDVSAESEAQL